MNRKESAADKLDAAMIRLLDGKPLHTSPGFLKENLYKEAQVSRATMNRNKQILARWDEAVRHKLEASTEEGITVCFPHEKQIAALSAALSAARRQVTETTENIRASATVIAALHAENLHLRQQLKAKQKGVVTSLPNNGGAAPP